MPGRRSAGAPERRSAGVPERRGAAAGQAKAETPVSCCPMTNWWISEVPS
ncbi:hypothetical protein GA0070609_6388 [Micromonospora echinaurantiaca]|uniref:Uncharacterized protein n=1 Tax=Micromonospora echinaurantiaca TaxID=47857 RepID=A0A1C5KC38_9ACTN|nr:hypothetical protein GA0070609_6388 [Micromonospora echinaurantiaca]